MMQRLSRGRMLEVWRYYQAGIVNTAFGFAAYSLLVWLGLNMFVAQLVSHFMGVAFNYLTYSRHVFRGVGPAKLRFVLSYVVNYLIGLGTLAVVSLFVASPYLAGFISIIIVSIINYFVLSQIVFRTETT